MVHNGFSIQTIIKDNDTFFKNADNIFVISLIYTGEEDSPKGILELAKIKFYYILKQPVNECPCKNNVPEDDPKHYKRCHFLENYSGDVMCFYNDKKI